MSLVTHLTAEEVQELQEEMQSPANVERLHKEFSEAFRPAEFIDPETGKTTTVWCGFLSTMGEWPEGTERIPVEGGYKVYHRDPTRHEKAKASQPTPGERPYPEPSPLLGTILRLGDGRMVLRTGVPGDYQYRDMSVDGDE